MQLDEAFAALEPLAPGLAGRLVRYVAGGGDAEALRELASLGQAACDALGIEATYLRHQRSSKGPPAWHRWFEAQGDGRDAEVLLRLAKVVTTPPPHPLTVTVLGRQVDLDRSRYLRALDPPEWLEPLLWEFTTKHQFCAGRVQSWWSNRLSAALVEDLLRADGYPTALLYRPAFPKDRFGVESGMLNLLGGLVGYGEGLARHPSIVREALVRGSAVEKVRALDQFQAHAVPVAPFAEPLAELAVSSARTVREAAATLLFRVAAEALPPLRTKAESGTPVERQQAVRLIGRLKVPEAREFLHARRGSEISAKVKAALDELLAEAPGAESSAPPPIDIFRGVALGDATRQALGALVEAANRRIATGQTRTYLGSIPDPIGPDALERGYALLVCPEPWDAAPEPTWLSLIFAAYEEFRQYLTRPELTPLHAVRLLRLVGGFRSVLNGGYVVLFDFESMLDAYRSSHEPPLDLRTLGAAFRASALDDLAIGREWFRIIGHRRLVWPDEACWPYFAEHLDWLEAAFCPSLGPSEEWGHLAPADRRRVVFSILGTFPEPPDRFVPRLWEVALGSSKAERPLAQRCLEKLPDCAEKVLAALTSRQREARIASAEWLLRLRTPGLADALERALRTERTDAVRNALMNAQEQFGARAATPSTATAASDARDELRAEAQKGLKSGIPKGLAWFPFDRLPEVRWSSDDAPIGTDVLTWLIVQAWKSKEPEPTAMLRRHAAGWRSDDAQRLGRSVFEAWLGHDLRPPTEEEVAKRAQEWDQIIGQLANMPAYQEMSQQFLEGRDQFLRQPLGSAVADKGVLAVVAACGPPSVARIMRAYLDEWYGNRVAQCRALVRMLAWIDHPEAIEVLLAVAKRFRTKSIRQEAETQARQLAARRGVALAELADRALPDAGLDAEGRLILDYGGRRFVARLVDDANLVLEDEAGKRLSALPAPRKADDPAKVEQAKRALADARSRIKGLRKTVADRLHEAMCTQRGWRYADWRASLLGHPFAGRLCRRLVWSADAPATTFRPLDDGSLTDPDDDEVRLAPDATIRLAHALTVPEAVARRWAEHLADYEVSPLFDQFAGHAFRLPEDRRRDTHLEAALGRPIARQVISRLAKGRGYDAAAFRAEDGGDSHIKHFPAAGLQAVIDVADGDDDEAGAVRSLSLYFLPAGEADRDQDTPRLRPLGEVPPVLLSACHADLIALAAPGSAEE